MSRSISFAWFLTDDGDIARKGPSRPGHMGTQIEDDPAASYLRRRYRHLGMAVLTRAINDAAGIGIVVADHPWTEDVDGEERMAAWLKDELRGLSRSEQRLRIRALMVADARTFLLSPEQEEARALWFRAAGVGYPGRARMAEIIERRRLMGSAQRGRRKPSGTSAGA